jgi:hypothetical protein
VSEYADYVKENFNSGETVVYTERCESLSDLLASSKIARVDVLKIDTDGGDFDVLRSLSGTFDEVRPLWIQVEVNLSPSGDQPDGAFSEVDGFLRPRGYTLIDLESWRYSRAALPDHFAYDIPAQTRNGPVAWADAIYVDDPLAVEAGLGRWLKRPDGLGRAIRLAALYDTFGFPDCAAELLVALRGDKRSADKADWTAMLDLLTPTNPYGATTYDAFIAAFEADPGALYPARSPEPAELSAEAIRLGRDLEVARRMLERRKRRMLLLSTRTVAAQAETERLRSKLAAVEAERAAGEARLEAAGVEERRLAAALEQAARDRADREAGWADRLSEARRAWDELAAAREREMMARHETEIEEVRALVRTAHDAHHKTALLNASRHADHMAALRSEHAHATELLAAEIRTLHEELKTQADQFRRREESMRIQSEAQLKALQEKLSDQSRRTSEREAAILARVREAWTLDAVDRGDIFDIVAAARKKSQRLQEEEAALQAEVNRFAATSASLRELLAHSGRFTLRRWLAKLRSDDVMKSLP